jgi:hypothetical protein
MSEPGFGEIEWIMRKGLYEFNLSIFSKDFYGTSCRAAIKLPLCHSLVPQQFYSAGRTAKTQRLKATQSLGEPS